MQPTEAQLLERRIWRHFSKGLTQYHLLDDGDHILLGLSGGKDSLALLDFMSRRARRAPHRARDLVRPEYRHAQKPLLPLFVEPPEDALHRGAGTGLPQDCVGPPSGRHPAHAAAQPFFPRPVRHDARPVANAQVPHDDHPSAVHGARARPRSLGGTARLPQAKEALPLRDRLPPFGHQANIRTVGTTQPRSPLLPMERIGAGRQTRRIRH